MANPIIAFVVLFLFRYLLLAIVKAFVGFLAPEPPDQIRVSTDAPRMTVSDSSEELRITVRGGRSRGRWPVILLPAAFLTSLPVLTLPLVGWEWVLPAMLPRLGPVLALIFFLTLFEATRSEVLTVRDGVLAVAQFWLGGKRVWHREVPVMRIRRLRYELEAGLCFFAGPRTIAVDLVDGKKRRFGVALSPEQANKVIEIATRRLITAAPIAGAPTLP